MPKGKSYGGRNSSSVTKKSTKGPSNRKDPNSKQGKSFMGELHFNGGGHAPSGKK